MIPLGTHSKLVAKRREKQGIYLVDDTNDEVLLPNKYVPKGMKIGEEIEVFVYTDSEDRIVATTRQPKVKLHQFAYLQVKEVTPFGAFLDWGLEKDLFVPFKEQRRKMQKGQWHIVYLYNDDESDRLVASAKLHKFFQREILTVEIGEEVNLLIGDRTDLGVNVIINNIHSGLIFDNEIFRPIEKGDRIRGYIKNIREDHKIDVALQKQGYQNIEPNAARILAYLKMNKGYLNLTDKSNPAAIKVKLEMSKKTFKKAIGALYKQRVIKLEKDGIYLR